MTYKTEGVILKYTNLGERDRLLTVYTKDFGKIYLKAKAVKISRSKLAGHLEVLTLSQLVVASGKFLDIVIDALAINNFKGIRLSLKKTAAAFCIAELVDSLTGEREPDRRIYDLLQRALDFLDQVGALHAMPLRLVVTRFGLGLLVLLGFAPYHAVQGFAPKKELNEKNFKVLEARFKYYLSFAPEQKIKALEFLRVVGCKGTS